MCGVFVDDETVVRDELRRLAAAEVEGRLQVAVTVDEQCRHRQGPQLAPQIGRESGEEEFGRRPAPNTPGTVES